MVAPVPGRIHPQFRAEGSMWKTCGFHTGLDIAAPRGTPIVAARAGIVRHTQAGASFGPNQFAVWCPDGTADFYAHTLDRPADGTAVQAGQQIATVGDLGNATGPHLHLERWPRHTTGWPSCGEFQDPQASVDAGGAAPPAQGGGWMFPPGHKVYAKYLRFDGHEQNADRESDSIKALQEALNRHSIPGGQQLPVTGRYFTETDEEVRLCQRHHIPPEDPAGASNVGPAQWRHIADATGCPYEYVP